MVGGVVTTLAEGVPNQPGGTSMAMIVGTGVLALVVSVVAWPIFSVFATIPHEGGHALMGSLMGGKVGSISMKADGEGLTDILSIGRFGGFLAGLCGYIGPSIFGIVGAALLAEHHIAIVLWTSVALLALTLLSARGWFTIAFTLLVGAGFFFVARYASPGQQQFVAYTWVWFLLLGGFRDVIHLEYLRRDKPDIGDVGILHKMTHLPGGLFVGFFWLFSLVVLVYGAFLMLGYMHIEGLWAFLKSQLVG